MSCLPYYDMFKFDMVTTVQSLILYGLLYSRENWFVMKGIIKHSYLYTAKTNKTIIVIVVFHMCWGAITEDTYALIIF